MENAGFLLCFRYSPVGITFLIGAQIAEMGDPEKELKRLLGYMLTVLLGLGIHAFIILPIMLLVLARRNPLKYVYGMLQALLTALGTSSRYCAIVTHGRSLNFKNRRLHGTLNHHTGL